MTTLKDIGWNNNFTQQWAKGGYTNLMPARVIADYGTKRTISLPQTVDAIVAGSLLGNAPSYDQPKVGDWVAVDQHAGAYRIHHVLPRSSVVARRAPGNIDQKQVLVANVDKAFLVVAADEDFSVNRLQRYIFQLDRQEIQHIVVLNKIDEVTDHAPLLDVLKKVTNSCIALSATKSESVEIIHKYIKPAETAVFLGSSGVGKSTLVNRLLKSEVQATQATRERDNKGRHTTVHRELFMLPGGGLIIDTPGLRELQIWGETSELDEIYKSISKLATRCKFNDCRHLSEPGCMVQVALKNGELDESTFNNFVKMRTELKHLNTAVDAQTKINKEKHIRLVSKALRKQHEKDEKEATY